MTITPDSLRQNLSDLAGQQAKAAASGGKIHDSARVRLGVVQARMEELRPKALTDQAAADEYQALTEETGRLNIVLGQARTAT